MRACIVLRHRTFPRQRQGWRLRSSHTEQFLWEGESCRYASWGTTARRTVSHLRSVGQIQVRNGDSPTKQDLLFRLCLCISLLALVSVNPKDDGTCVR